MANEETTAELISSESLKSFFIISRNRLKNENSIKLEIDRRAWNVVIIPAHIDRKTLCDGFARGRDLVDPADAVSRKTQEFVYINRTDLRYQVQRVLLCPYRAHFWELLVAVSLWNIDRSSSSTFRMYAKIAFSWHYNIRHRSFYVSTTWNRFPLERSLHFPNVAPETTRFQVMDRPLLASFLSHLSTLLFHSTRNPLYSGISLTDWIKATAARESIFPLTASPSVPYGAQKVSTGVSTLL